MDFIVHGMMWGIAFGAIAVFFGSLIAVALWPLRAMIRAIARRMAGGG